MKYILSSKNIPELERFELNERHQIIEKAVGQLNAPEKLALNILKLLILLPIFIFLSKESWGLVLVSLLGALLGYVVLLRPLTLGLASKYIQNIVKKHAN